MPRPSLPLLVTLAVLAAGLALPVPQRLATLALLPHASRQTSSSGREPACAISSFLDAYLEALTECDVSAVGELYSPDYVAFVAQGNPVDREQQLAGMSLFCRPPAEMGLKGTAFSLLEAVEIAPMIVFLRIRATNEAVFVRGPVDYSQALLLKELEKGKIVIKREVQTASSEAFAAAVTPQEITGPGSEE